MATAAFRRRDDAAGVARHRLRPVHQKVIDSARRQTGSNSEEREPGAAKTASEIRDAPRQQVAQNVKIIAAIRVMRI